MYHSEKDTLHKVSHKAADISVPKSYKQRKLHKAFLRYHDPENWALLREALMAMGRSELIGNGKQHLIPGFRANAIDKLKEKSYGFKTRYTHSTIKKPGKPAG
jgi:hypothetical protein